MEQYYALIAILSLVIIVSMAAIIRPYPPFRKRWQSFIVIAILLSCIGVLSRYSFSVESDDSDEEHSLEANGIDDLWYMENETNPENAESLHNNRYWVTTDRLNRRTCPSTSCGIVGRLFFREAVVVYEIRDGWARISNYYDASCVNGVSQYVDSGNARCLSENGIINGSFAEWVSEQFLSRQRPPDPVADATAIEALVAQSDDYHVYGSAFVAAARSLISSETCTTDDFREIGGWVKSTNHSSEPIYFTYCGGFTLTNRLYLNAVTGEMFR